MEKIKASPALAWNNVKSLAVGKGSEAALGLPRELTRVPLH